MNTEIHNSYINALLADASYVDGLQSGDLGNVLSDRLASSKRFPAALATYIGDHFRVITQYTDPDGLTGSGFSVTVFEELSSGQRYISMRGTELTDALHDFTTDTDVEILSGLARTQVLEMVNWYKRATTPVGQEVTQISPILSADYGITGDGSLLVNGAQYTGQYMVNGHSLGGHLTTVFSRLFGQDVGTSNTFNGLGVGGILKGRLTTELMLGRIETLLGLSSTAWPSEAEQNNYWAEHGINGATLDGWLQQYGTRIPLFNEEGTGIPNHLMYKLTDSLALADALGMLDNNLTLSRVDTIFNAASNTPVNSLEKVLDGLRQTFLNKSDKTTVGDVEGNAASRSNYQQNLAELTASSTYQSLIGKVTLTTSTTSASEARNDFGVFLSLMYLTPFILKTDGTVEAIAALGAVHPDLESKWQEDNRLTPEQIANGEANFSDMWLNDRAAMLSWELKVNAADKEATEANPYVGLSSLLMIDTSIPSQYFEDKTTNQKIVTGAFNPSIERRRFIFGTDTGSTPDDTLTGGDNSDHLYGMAGADTLNGGKGNDRLEGGEGIDTLKGGEGADILYGGAEADTLNGDEGRDRIYGGNGDDILQGGQDNDTLYGGADNDTYKFSSGDGWDWITDSDGLGKITYNGKEIRGGNKVADNVWQDADKNTYSLYSMTENGQAFQYLSIQGSGGGMWVKQWQAGNLGISLDNATTEPPQLPVYAGEGNMKNTLWYDDHDNNPDNDHIVITEKDSPPQQISAIGTYGEVIGNGTLIGNGSDNYLHSWDGDSTIYGGRGRDMLWGDGIGTHTLYGGDDDDVLTANYVTDDIFYGEDGNDVLAGGAGKDVLIGGAGNDLLMGGGLAKAVRYDWSVVYDPITNRPTEFIGFNPWETLSGDDIINNTEYYFNPLGGSRAYSNSYNLENDSADNLSGGTGDDTLWGGQGDDVLDGGDDKDELLGNAGNDFLQGGNGDDRLFGDNTQNKSENDNWYTYPQFHGNDILDGGDGNDMLVGDGGDDELHGGSGADELIGDNVDLDGQYHGNDILDGGDGADKLWGGGGADILSGGDGDDEISGDDITLSSEFHGKDILNGGAGNDKLFGNGGNDTLDGGIGDDRLQGGEGDDQLMGGDGIDVLFGERGNDVLNGGVGDDQLQGGEDDDQLLGNEGDDYLLGDAGNDALDGGAGNDRLEGGAGNDILDGGSGVDTMVGGAGNDTLYGGGEGVLGADGIYTGGDVLQGGAGDDTYIAGAGDYIDDNEGNNTIVIRGANSAGSIVMMETAIGEPALIVQTGGGDAIFIKGGLTNDSFNYQFDDGSQISQSDLVAISLNDAVNVTTSSSVAFGGTQNDTLTAATAINTTLNGAAGNDTLIGSTGNDVLKGGAGDDTLIGNAGNDQLNGGTGADTMSGGGNNDVYQVDNTGDSVVENASQGTDRVESSISYSLGNNVEDLTLIGSDAINGMGNELANRLIGNGAANTLNGGFGNDTIEGLAGNDVLDGGVGDDNLQGGEGDDLLNGGVGDDIMAGGAGDDTYTLSIGDGFDMIEDTQGLNQISFGAGVTRESIHASQYQGDDGNYYLLVQYGSGTDSVAIKDGLAGGIQSYRLSDGTVITHAELIGTDGVPFHVYGTQNADTLWGTTAADTLEGKAGDDQLLGLAGDDTLLGGSGSDTLIGGAGNDLLDGGLGNDQLEGGAGQDSYLMRWGMGRDTVIDGADGELNIIKLDTGINLADIATQRNGDDLFLQFKGNEEGLLIKNYYSGGQQWDISTDSGATTTMPDFIANSGTGNQTFIEQAIGNYEARVKALYYQTLGQDGYTLGADGLLHKTKTEVTSYSATTYQYESRFEVVTQQADTVDIERVSSPYQNIQNLLSSSVTSASTLTGSGYGGSLAGGGATFHSFNGTSGGFQVPQGSGVWVGSGGAWIVPPAGGGSSSSGSSTYSFITSSYQVDASLALEKIQADTSDNHIIVNGYAVVDAGDGNDVIEADTGGSGWESNYNAQYLPNEYRYEKPESRNIGSLLYGNSGDDVIKGSTANDVLIGGEGSDQMDGGQGADTYYISAGDLGVDLIQDSGHIRGGYEVNTNIYLDWYYRSIGINDWESRYFGWDNYTQGEGLPALPVISPTDYTALAPLYAAGIIDMDMVELGSGINLADIQVSWGQTDQADIDNGYSSPIGRLATLDISWGENQGIRVAIPLLNLEGVADSSQWWLGAGIEQFKFADGTVLSMKDMIGLAPTMPAFDPFNSQNNLITFDVGSGVKTISYLWRNEVSFGANINPIDITIGRDGVDLLLSHVNGVDQLRIQDWYADSNSPSLIHARFNDGTYWDSYYLTDQGLLTPLVGTAGDDVLVGLHGYTNTIMGMGGNDQLTGGTADDSLDGGDGNDSIYGGNGSDTLFGGSESDQLNGGEGDDLLMADARTSTIIVRARASLAADVGANLELWIDGVNAGAVEVRSTSYTDYSFDVTLPAGRDVKLDVIFANDAVINGQDRNLFVESVMVDDYLMRPTDNGVSYDRGTASTAFDGMNVIAGQSTMAWNGALRFTVPADVVGAGGDDWLDGGTGDDTMIGGIGNDAYIVDSEDDEVTEFSNEGIDNVQSNITYTLGANLENLILTGSEVINGTGNVMNNLLAGNAANNSLFGGAGSDLLYGGDGDDLLSADERINTITVRAKASLAADIGANMELWVDGVKVNTIVVSSTDYADYSFDVALPVGHDVTLDVVFANDAVINGQDRNLFVESVMVDDYLMRPTDNGVSYDRGTSSGAFDGVNVIAGQSTMAWNGALRFNVPQDAIALDGSDIVIGGIGNDTITTGTGYDIIAFNKGDGQDILNASTGADNTISLGGGMLYSDLSLSKSGNDLILEAGATDQITLKDWYLGTANKSVVNLQVIAEAMADFSLGSSDSLRNNNVESFNFADLVSQFDAEGAAANWQLTDARLTAHLQAGSDTAAIGGDLTYQYGKAGSLTGVGLLAAQNVINAASFGQTAQTLNNPSVWQAEVVKLG